MLKRLKKKFKFCIHNYMIVSVLETTEDGHNVMHYYEQCTKCGKRRGDTYE